MSKRFLWVAVVAVYVIVGLTGCGAYWAERGDARYDKLTQQFQTQNSALIVSQYAAIDAQLEDCRRMKKSPSSPYFASSKQRCDVLAEQKTILANQQIDVKRRRCEDIAFSAEGGLYRPVDYIPIVGGFTWLDRYEAAAFGEKARTFGEKGKKVYEECMAGP